MTVLGVTMHETLKRDIAAMAVESGHTSASWARMKLQDLVRRSVAASRAVAVGRAK